MKLPFTIDQFLNVLVNYNVSVWPMQVVLVLFALVGIALLIKKNKYSDKIITIILSLFWLWMGIVYHITFFTTINNAAYLFDLLFIAQGILFLFSGIVKTRLAFKFKANLYGLVGSLFLLYALIIYPVLSY